MDAELMPVSRRRAGRLAHASQALPSRTVGGQEVVPRRCPGWAQASTVGGLGVLVILSVIGTSRSLMCGARPVRETWRRCSRRLHPPVF
eukprot:4937748-Pyramimonas_sp.AAC.1